MSQAPESMVSDSMASESMAEVVEKTHLEGREPIVSQRLHPLSLVFESLSLVRRNIVPALFAGVSAASWGMVGLGIGTTVFVIAITVSAFKYFTFRYSILGRELVIDHGLLFRRNRTIPLERIHNIDMVQNPLHRMLGVGEVRVETASGNEPEAILRVLDVSQLQRLRSGVFGRSALSQSVLPDSMPGESPQAREAGVSPPESDADAAKAAQQVEANSIVYTIPTRRLVLAGLCSNRGIVLLGVAVGFLWQLRFANSWVWSPERWIEGSPTKHSGREFARDLIQEGSEVRGVWEWLRSGSSAWQTAAFIALAVVAAGVAIKVLSAAWYVLRFHGYRLELIGNDFRVRCGLWTQVTATVPRHRVQVVSVHRPWLERALGLAHLRVETAGAKTENEDATSTVGRRWFLPVVLEKDVPMLLRHFHPQLSADDGDYAWQALSPRAGRRWMRQGVLLAIAFGVLGSFLSLRWGWTLGLVALGFSWALIRKKLKSRSLASKPWGIVLKSGILYRKWSVTFFDKIQTVRYLQSPFDRRWGMAGLAIDTPGAGPADHPLRVSYLDDAVARRRYEEVVGQLRCHQPTK